MGRYKYHLVFGLLVVSVLPACETQQKRMNVAAPLPPMTDTTFTPNDLQNIKPANGLAMAAAVSAAPTSCSFSSFHRKHTVGYELDESRHISFKVNPSFDFWSMSDFDTEVSLRFTKAIGGPANKRPKCKYGSGFYGLVPYATNEGVNMNGLFESGNIKSFVEEKLDERERRRQERAEKSQSI